MASKHSRPNRRAALCSITTAIAAIHTATAAPLLAQTTPAPSQADRSRVVYDAYILGPGDSLQIELLDIPELSGTFSIGPDGTLYLPRLRALYVEGLTVEELRYFLTEQFKAYVKKPELYVRPVGYRPVRIYVGGEVKRPGYYTLSGSQELTSLSTSAEASQLSSGTAGLDTRPGLNQVPGSPAAGAAGAGGISTFGALFPTVFDAIRTAQGITPYSDLSQVQVTRKQALSAGGGRMRAQLDFLSVITDGEESQNIRLFDGDVVSVGRSAVVLREQLLKAGQTNLSPQFLQVFVSGRVTTPGPQTLPQGSSLNQAIVSAGGLKVLHGKVEFVRFTREGEIDRRTFGYNPNAASDDYRNPILMAGDIIRIQESPLSATVTVLNELTGPAVGIYSVYSLFNNVR
jgi:polysaccharide export outer membrane protein